MRDPSHRSEFNGNIFFSELGYAHLDWTELDRSITLFTEGFW